MIYFKFPFTRLYWEKYFSFKIYALSVFSVFGFFWTVLETIDRIVPSAKTNAVLQQNWMIFTIVSLGLIIAFIKSTPVLSAYHQYKETDVQLGFSVDSFFKIRGDKVISCNTGFHVRLRNEQGHISENSLQGQWKTKYFSNTANLEALMAASLARDSLQVPTSIGAVTSLTHEDTTYYLVALTNFNTFGTVTNSSFDDVQTSLNNIWQYIAEKGHGGEIVIPLVGSGLSRINKNRVEIAKEIVRSFTAAISQGKFCNKLTICILPKDMFEYQLDLLELKEFIQHTCKFTEFSLQHPRNGNIGTQIP